MFLKRSIKKQKFVFQKTSAWGDIQLQEEIHFYSKKKRKKVPIVSQKERNSRFEYIKKAKIHFLMT